MAGTYNLLLVGLSFLVASLASYVALNLVTRMYVARGAAARNWLIGGALAMGIGIWSTHFIGMLAFQLPIPTSYDLHITALSLATGILVSGFALYTINRGRLGLRRLLASGSIMGVGIAAMHYIGMASMRMQPGIDYDIPLFALSFMIAIAGSVGALWLAFRLRSVTVKRVLQKRIAGALLLGLAITAMHYTGMAAASFAPDTFCLAAPQQVNTMWLAAAVACCAVLLLSGTMLIRGGERALMADIARPMGIRLKIGLVFLGVVAMVAAFVMVSLSLIVEFADRAALQEGRDVAISLAHAAGPSEMSSQVSAQQFIERIAITTGRDVTLVDTHKKIVADADRSTIGVLFAASDDAVGRTLADGQSRAFADVAGSQSVVHSFVVALRSEQLDAKSPIVGALVLDYTRSYDAFLERAMAAASLIAALGLAVVFVTSILGLRVVATVSPKLVALTRGARALASGDYKVRVAASANDEIGALANAFNRMAEDLEASHAALVTHQQELESRVASRTIELREAEESSRQVAEELRLVSEHMPVGLCYVDRELRFHHHNKRYTTLTGLPDDGIDGRTLPEVVSPTFYGAIRRYIDIALDGRQVVYERSNDKNDAASGRLQTTLVPRVKSDGSVVGIYAMVQDISQRERDADQLRRSNEKLTAINQKLRVAQNQLLQAEKMASIGQLASGVAHEINNPIGYVCSNLGTLDHYLAAVFQLIDRYEVACRTIDGEATRAELQEAREAADIDYVRSDIMSLLAESQEGITRVKQIVNDLKNFSRSSGDEEWQWADLHNGIDSTLNIVMNELKYKADIVKEYGDLPNVQCRPSQLNQVFMNMLVNGADAIVKHGTIAIRSGVEGEQVWVEFSDTGQGIARDYLDRIFEPFFTTKAVGKGTGLGLAVSYGIVSEHNGRIDVASEPGKGTTFRVWLPVRQAVSSDANEAKEMQQA